MCWQVLTRDVADVVGEHIAVSIGYRKKDDDDSARPVPQNICALCGCELHPDEASAAEEGGAAAVQTAPSRLQQPQPSRPVGGRGAATRGAVRVEGAGGEAIFRLECSHS